MCSHDQLSKRLIQPRDTLQHEVQKFLAYVSADIFNIVLINDRRPLQDNRAFGKQSGATAGFCVPWHFDGWIVSVVNPSCGNAMSNKRRPVSYTHLTLPTI